MRMADPLLFWAGDICAAAAAIGCLYMAFASVLVLRFGKGRRESVAEELSPAPATLLVPLCGADPGLAERLERLCRQDYPAPVQVLCGLQDPADPAIAAVRSVQVDRPDVTLDLHVEEAVRGSNLKISNLINMMKDARHDILVLVDSDMEVGPGYLGRVVAALQRPRVGAVTCLYRGIAPEGLWARFSAMAIDVNFLPNVVLALAFDLARPCFGATIAIQRHTLQRIGGFRAFAEQLWDDFAIGESVRDLGYEVAVPPFALGHVCTERSWSETIANQLRYSRTIRGIDPVGYAGGVITYPFPLALIAIVLGGGEDALLVAFAALFLRLVLTACVQHRFGYRALWMYALLPFRDLLSFGVYVVSFFGATVVWHGHRYRVAPDGTMMPTAK